MADETKQAADNSPLNLRRAGATLAAELALILQQTTAKMPSGLDYRLKEMSSAAKSLAGVSHHALTGFMGVHKLCEAIWRRGGSFRKDLLDKPLGVFLTEIANRNNICLAVKDDLDTLQDIVRAYDKANLSPGGLKRLIDSPEEPTRDTAYVLPIPFYLTMQLSRRL